MLYLIHYFNEAIFSKCNHLDSLSINLIHLIYIKVYWLALILQKESIIRR